MHVSHKRFKLNYLSLTMLHVLEIVANKDVDTQTDKIK